MILQNILSSNVGNDLINISMIMYDSFIARAIVNTFTYLHFLITHFLNYIFYLKDLPQIVKLFLFTVIINGLNNFILGGSGSLKR